MKNIRINKFDNMKGIAILMVLFWHLMPYGVVPQIFFKYAYVLSLPVFFFTAGYFSKIGPDEPAKAFKRLLVPYIVFTIILKIFKYLLTGKINIDLIFIQASVAMWFLIALFFMKMALPIVDRFRYPVIIAMICALLFGIIDIHPNILGLTRAFAYFPIFLLGFYYKPYKEKFTKMMPRLYSYYDRHFTIIFIVSIIVITLILNGIDGSHMIYKSVYKGNILYEMIKRLIILVVSMALVLLLNRAMTNRYTILTKFGKNSMAVYILHIFLLIYLSTVPELFVMNKPVTAIVALAMIFVVAFVLSRDIVTKYFNKLNDWVADLILRHET